MRKNSEFQSAAETDKMAAVAEKLGCIEIEMAADSGNFKLFALVEREDALGRWDVVVAADWADDDRKALIGAIAARISKKLDRDEQCRLSRIVVLGSGDAAVGSLNRIAGEFGMPKQSGQHINGIIIMEAYRVSA